MTVEITKVLRTRLEGRDSGPMIVTVIPEARSWPSGQEGVTENLLKFERLALVTYDRRTRRGAIQAFGLGLIW
jgi:hypothetical protein